MGTRDDEERVPNELADVDFESEDELGTVGAAQAKLKKLKEELSEAKKERQEYLDGWQRCKADSVNAHREALQAAQRAVERAQEAFIERVIPVIDSFDMATAGDTWNSVDATWRKGVEGIRSQLLVSLKESGASYFGETGEEFDPQKHEALEEIESDGTEGTVARVIRRGWMFEGRIIRPAQVSLVKHRS